LKNYFRFSAKSLLVAVTWFSISFIINTVVGYLFYEKTVPTYTVLMTFCLLQFLLGFLFVFLLNNICSRVILEIIFWMVVMVLIERIFFRSYIFYVVDFMVLASIAGDAIAGFAGFLFGVYIRMVKGVRIKRGQ